MDFTLALTHFCEVHGPKSVLCTQVLPLECALCLPPTAFAKSEASFESYATQVHDGDEPTPAPFSRSDTDFTLPPGLSHASTAIEESTENIENHPFFVRTDTTEIQSKFPYARAHGDTCASCTFSVPRGVTAKLPPGAPGSFDKDGKTQNGAPVLRSREFVCLGKNDKKAPFIEPASSHGSKSSFGSFGSIGSHGTCHDHTLTYLTAKSPEDPDNYAQLRASVVRAFTCEQLPKNMSEGPLCYGNSESGYTVAYVFRLTDSKARGRTRRYAFVALAGKDACRAFKACPMLWDAFATMAKIVEQAAHRCQEAQAQQERNASSSHASTDVYTPPSSFLTQRAVDPDGYPRRAGRIEPRSLAAIVGDDNIFAILHQYFVAVLRRLGEKFGGMPMADRKAIYQSLANEKGVASSLKRQVSKSKPTDDDDDDNDTIMDDEPEFSPSYTETITDISSTKGTSTMKPTHKQPVTKTKQTQIKRNSQCAPIKVDKNSTSQRVAV